MADFRCARLYFVVISRSDSHKTCEGLVQCETAFLHQDRHVTGEQFEGELRWGGDPPAQKSAARPFFAESTTDEQRA
jgi:hypothetical protein